MLWWISDWSWRNFQCFGCHLMHASLVLPASWCCVFYMPQLLHVFLPAPNRDKWNNWHYIHKWGVLKQEDMALSTRGPRLIHISNFAFSNRGVLLQLYRRACASCVCIDYLRQRGLDVEKRPCLSALVWGNFAFGWSQTLKMVNFFCSSQSQLQQLETEVNLRLQEVEPLDQIKPSTGNRQ